jgi:ketosteroid isomerase-like protein
LFLESLLRPVGYLTPVLAFTRADEVKAGGQVKKAAGQYLFILKKQSDGSWKIARDIWD